MVNQSHIVYFLSLEDVGLLNILSMNCAKETLVSHNNKRL